MMHGGQLHFFFPRQPIPLAAVWADNLFPIIIRPIGDNAHAISPMEICRSAEVLYRSRKTPD